MSDASKGTNTTSNAIKLFYSYAPADENLCQELEDHLALLQRQCHIAGWQRRSISPGSNWQEEITAQLDAAQLILLLVSASFIASDKKVETANPAAVVCLPGTRCHSRGDYYRGRRGAWPYA